MDSSNPNPTVYEALELPRRTFTDGDYEGDSRDLFDASEVYEMLRTVRDPEHPVTLEQLKVISPTQIRVRDDSTGDTLSTVSVEFTPTIAHCSMATLIGLSIRAKLSRSLPRRFKTTVTLSAGSHATEEDVNKQINDKERIAAAMENPALLNVINQCLVPTDAE